LSGITRVTDGQSDGQTDRILLAIPRLHYMQGGENERCGLELRLNYSDNYYYCVQASRKQVTSVRCVAYVNYLS